MDGDGPVNVQQLVESAPGRIAVLDSDRRVVASNFGLEPGRRVGDVEDALVLFVGDLPELSAYQELRAGFTAAVSHELRTPLARLLVLIESVTLPGADVEELLEQARQEVEQARELIDEVLFLGELETGRAVVALGSTRARPVVDQVVGAWSDRAAAAEVRLVVRGRGDVELPLRPRMLRAVVENLVANAIRYAGPGATCAIELDARIGNSAERMQQKLDALLLVQAADKEQPFGCTLSARRKQIGGHRHGRHHVKHSVTSAGGRVEATGSAARGLTIACSF